MHEAQKDPKIICWDLDQTLGHFYGLAYLTGDIPKTNIPTEYRSLSIRRNIRPVLQTLANADFTHYLTTSASEAHAREALGRSKLDRFFGERIWDASVTSDENGYGKLYGDIEESFPREDMYQHNMLVVGDSFRDRPADLRQLVFLHQEQGYLYDAQVVENIINRLQLLGQGSFLHGFEKIYQTSPTLERVNWNGISNIPVKNSEIVPGVFADLAFVHLFRQESAPEGQYPIISNVVAPDFRRTPEVVEVLFPEES